MKSTTLQSQLLSRIKKGEKKAIEQLYEMAFKPASGIVLKDGGTLDDAKEVFQEALFSLLLKLKRPDFEIRTNLRAYICQTCFNIWVKTKRQNRKQVSTAVLPVEMKDVDVSEERTEKERQFQMMEDCLSKGTKECQDMLKLTYYKKLSDKEIAPILNYSEQFVRTKRRRCMKKMRACMESKMG